MLESGHMICSLLQMNNNKQVVIVCFHHTHQLCYLTFPPTLHFILASEGAFLPAYAAHAYQIPAESADDVDGCCSSCSP